MKIYDYVNIELGSDNKAEFSHGNIYPVCAVPHGMTSFSLQTNGGLWFYNPNAEEIEGIRLTHIPSPWIGDYGHMLFSVTNKPSVGITPVKVKKNEKILRPDCIGYKTENVSLSVTPTIRGAVFDFSAKYLVLSFFGETKWKVENGKIIGYTCACDHKTKFDFKEYFVIEPTCTFTAKETLGKLCVEFSEDNGSLFFATSFISEKQTLVNLKDELDGKTFQSVKETCVSEWENYFSKIEIDAPEQQKAMFYSCMYRAYLFPRIFYEYDEYGNKIHLNVATGEISRGTMYTDNGFWDTYRTVYPFLSLIDTALYADIIEGLYNIYKDIGSFPRWIAPDPMDCMPGNLIEAVFADAIVKNIVSEDLANKILDAMLIVAEKEETDERLGRKAVNAYRKLGYVPNDIKESVNETLDFVYGDYCISRVANHLGKYDIAEKYYKYSLNYAKLFDKDTGFMRSKNSSGEMRETFSQFAWGGDYTEGSAWHSSFAVFHDINGLNNLYGGKLEQKIDELFATPPIYETGGYCAVIHEMREMAQFKDFGQCAICNQPSFHIPFIYSELGNVEKTGCWVKKIVEKAFKCTPDGFPGDEDNGTMACWYIFACLGIYPFCVGRGDFNLSIPLIDAKIKLFNGKILQIEKGKIIANNANTVGYFDLIK